MEQDPVERLNKAQREVTLPLRALVARRRRERLARRLAPAVARALFAVRYQQSWEIPSREEIVDGIARTTVALADKILEHLDQAHERDLAAGKAGE